MFHIGDDNYMSLSENAKQYNDVNCEKQLRTELNSKVDNLIKQANVANISAKIEELRSTKIGLFGKMLGKDKEVQLKIKNLELGRKLMQLEESEQRDATPNEIMSKIESYKRENNGNLTEELYAIETQIKKVFRVDDREVKRLADEQSSRGMLVPQKEVRSIFKRTPKIILQQINRNMEYEIDKLEQERQNPYKRQMRYVERTTDRVQNVYECINGLRDALLQDRMHDRQVSQLRKLKIYHNTTSMRIQLNKCIRCGGFLYEKLFNRRTRNQFGALYYRFKRYS